METWTLSVTGQNPILSSDGKWIIAGHGNASITEVATRVSKVISKPGFVGGFYSDTEARLIHSDISTIYSLKKENNWEPVPLPSTYNRGNTYAVGSRHSAINRQATGDYNIILDDVVLVDDNKCLTCDTNDDFLAFAHNEGNQVYWVWVYDITRKTYDKFKPKIGANVIRTNCGYTSYGYLDKCWIRTPTGVDQDITANPYGGESAACIINVGGVFWALTYTEYNNNPNGFCILRPIGDKKVITIPFGGKRPDGKFVDGHFIVTAATANGRMSLAKIPLNEERKLIPPPVEPEPPNPEPEPVPNPNGLEDVKRNRIKYNDMPQGTKRAWTITNASAWDLRDSGAGMFFKDSGQQYNDRNINCILFKHRPGVDPSGKGEMYDVLKSAETVAEPRWGRTTPSGYGDITKWRAPVEPEGSAPPNPIPENPDRDMLIHIRDEINEFLGEN